MDHLIQILQVGRAWDPMPEPFVTLGLLAGRTSRLRLGTLVSPMSFRSPGVVAKSVAALDVLTGGRAFCGVGAGWGEREHLAHGVAFPPAGERVDRLAAGIETMRALWSSGTKAYEGQHVSLPEPTSYPRPVGTLPVVVRGSGRRVLRVAAELGDACNVRTAVLDQVFPVLRQHRRGPGGPVPTAGRAGGRHGLRGAGRPRQARGRRTSGPGGYGAAVTRP